VISATGALNFSGLRRLPMIRQSEAAECGLACLAMIAGFHGYRTSLQSLRAMYPTSLKGSTLQSLVEIADGLGLSARPLRVELDSLHRLKLPCVLHWDLNHFVVLKAARRSGCTIHDPALGERDCSFEDVSPRFTGIALELLPTRHFRRQCVAKAMRLTDLWGRTIGLKRVLAQALLLSLVVQLFVLASPFYMQLVVDEVLTKFDTDLLVVLALGFALLMLINVLATALRACVILYLANTLGFQLVANLFRHLLRLPLDWFEKRHAGDILSRFSSTVPIRDLISEGLIASVIDGLMAISTIFVMFLYSPTLATFVLAALAACLALRLAYFRPLRRGSEDVIVARAREQSVLIESVRAVQSIKLYGKEAERGALWQNRQADVVNNSVRVGRLGIGFDAANGLLFGIENTVIVYLGALLVVDGGLTVGMLFAFMAYKRQFIDKATKLVERLFEFRMLDLHLERIADIGLAMPESDASLQPVQRPGPGAKQRRAGKLELRNVSFRYGVADPWVLCKASIVIGRGEMITILGPSGGGKSTLIKVLLGLFEPTSGEVLVDGIALQRYGVRQFRQQIGTVMQDDALLAGSVADNISFFDPDADPGKVMACAERACIHRDIAAMPMGYNSLVGDMGDLLSAGQRQRILLARALYRDPGILVLDEGTANLDAGTEQSIVEVLRDLDVTRVCVAHRKALITVADRIVVLQNGGLREIVPAAAGHPFTRPGSTPGRSAGSSAMPPGKQA
jgi:ATP-binding cassette subfamily B protein RaxB